MSSKKDIKISNKLLSWVLGCECEFVKVKFDKLYFGTNKTIESIAEKCKFVSPRSIPFGDRGNKNIGTINLHTFIHLAKIKAFECGYDIIEYSNFVKILSIKTFYPKVNYNRFTIELIIEALEWVAEKVGGDK